jgi:hypothetical protein
MYSAFANAGQPHGALFNDAPRQPYHVTDAAMLRAAYGPAAVPSVADPAADDEYTWTEQALPAGLPEAAPTAHDRRLAELDAGLRALQADVRRLEVLVHQLLNAGEEPDAE